MKWESLMKISLQNEDADFLENFNKMYIIDRKISKVYFHISVIKSVRFLKMVHDK